MADQAKQVPVVHGGTLISDLKSLFSILKARRTVAFLYGFMFAFVVCTILLAFNPNSNGPFLSNFFSSTTTAVGSSSSSSSSSSFSSSPRSQFSSVYSFFFPNSSSSEQTYNSLSPPPPLETNFSRSINTTFSTPTVNEQIPISQNLTQTPSNPPKPENLVKNQTRVGPSSNATSLSGEKNQTQTPENSPASANKGDNAQESKPKSGSSEENNSKKNSEMNEKGVKLNNTKQSNENKSGVSVEQNKKKSVDLVESLKKCDLFDGSWVKDESYKVYYKPGSCSIVDEQFDCILNGRPDKDYQKFRWKPKGCDIPRLDGKHMLEMIRGKRLVFVGDSLNRNMWESLVCILKNSVKNPKNVFEAHGRHSFRGEAEYSFVFKDYDCTVEFYVTPFLVQEWEISDKNGTKKETLRLDLVGKSAEHYKTADIIVFNTGHWWTHDKTSKGQDYYQEGSHVYPELNVLEAFRKALTTWGRWVDANVDAKKTTVLFRGYSDSHFSGGQWNSGGACDSETVPISDEKYLRPYEPKMVVLEKILKGMRTQVTYLNVTRLTDFRKDGHPSIYRKQNLSEEERRSPLLYQDCSHWCLPGVPDTWNELLYAELLVKLGHQQQQQKKKQT